MYIAQYYFPVPKDVRLYTTHFLLMKILKIVTLPLDNLWRYWKHLLEEI